MEADGPAPHVFVEDVSVESIARLGDAYRSTNLRERLARHHRGPVDVLRIADCGHAAHVQHPEPVIGAPARFIGDLLHAP